MKSLEFILCNDHTDRIYRTSKIYICFVLFP